ncbi:glycosyl hydrolase [Aspergillus avenaceus]|uniref:Glycosyl hydrolase n=1 Tax=Aspergillus avenaceus TaxID=36643 RepID=A0A5N6TFJ1_ASPAV|nr:glycosyl hydrolase [Aspergillus avenaceus]
MRLPSAAEVLAARQVISPGAIDYTAPPPDLTTLPEGSLFETWRPRIHVLPPNGQIGDPCAHYSDPATGLFHVGFLHNGTGIAAVYTDDLVHYRDVNPNGDYVIVAGGANDPLGVFDGSVIPSGVDGQPTLLYTSVSALPIHWTLPYTPGSETQSLAVTYNEGHNFTKLDLPPVIPSPAPDLDVTAFRDPFVFQNGRLDDAAGSTPGTWYATISGGIHDVGPGFFLYRNVGTGFTDWEYLGEWWQEPLNSTWGNGDWAKVFGYNWETGNAVSLDETGYNVNGETFLTFGVEGSYVPIQPSVSSVHAQLWAAGDVGRDSAGNVAFTPTMAGVLDWGSSAYAGAGKVIPSDSQASQRSGAPDRFLSYIWLTGDVFGGVTGFPSAQQSWQNSLLLPRELSVDRIFNVVNNELAQEADAWRVEDKGNGCAELVTLGINIARETLDAAKATVGWREDERTISTAGTVPFDRSPETRFFVLEAELSFPRSARNSGTQAGFQILASELESTTIFYQFSNESIIIDRSNTTAAGLTTSGFDASPESGRLRLFDLSNECGPSSDKGHASDKDKDSSKDKQSEGHSGSSKKKDGHRFSAENVETDEIETLALTIVVDNSILEVYANSRFALSTYVRPWYHNSTDIRFFHNGVGSVSFSDVNVYDGLYDAYPERDL